MEREKKEVHTLCVALSSLFKSEIIKKYFDAIDDALADTDPDRTPEEAKTARFKRSVNRLGDLSQLMSEK